jgi:HK97 family phage major capsid protein
MAVAAGKGSYSDTLAYAKRWDPQTPEVSAYIKAQEGSTGIGSPTWGTELVYAQNLVSEFVELLRAATVVDKLSGLRRVPFNVRIPVQTGGSNVNWVGEAAPKPVTELAFDEIILEQDKIAGIVVLTEELIRLSSPNAEEVVRRDLVEQIARFIDVQFLTASVTATENNPASVTNGVSAITGSGSTADDLYSDLNAALAQFDDNEMGEASIHIIMPPSLARGISSLRNALGQFEFRDVSRSGGTLMGFPVIVSSSTPSGTIVIVKADEILMADDGRVTLDASNQATIDMNGGHNPTFNLWQRNCVGIRAERWITWKKRRTDAVALISSATYGPPVGS